MAQKSKEWMWWTFVGVAVAIAVIGTIVAVAVRSPSPQAAQDERDKEIFIRIVQERADDPGNLEIIKWEPKGSKVRFVRFRCNLIGHRGIVPVRVEDAEIVYEGGRFSRIYLPKTFVYWHNE